MTNLDLTVRQKLSVTANLITSIQIMSLSLVELYSYLEKESEDNVFIDYDDFFENKLFRDYIKDTRGSLNNSYTTDTEELDVSEITRYEPTLSDILIEQLVNLNLNEEDYLICKLIILNLDEDGYFRAKVKEISELIGINDEKVVEMLKKLKTLEPRGIAAKNLQECLILQLEQEDSVLVNLIENHLQDIYKNKLEEIAKAENISIDKVKKYIKIIKSLNPKPASGYKTKEFDSMQIYPEIVVNIRYDDLQVSIKEGMSNVQINQYYMSLLSTDIDEETKTYLKKKLARTMLIIKSIENRKKTIEKISNVIVGKQREFFLYDKPLQQVSIKDIANITNLSESTVSRAVRGKYIQTPKGTYPMKFLLSTHISTHCEEGTSKDKVCEEIRQIIEKEDKKKPLSDSKITKILNLKGIDIKRRTVAKYRDELGIENTQSRKILV